MTDDLPVGDRHVIPAAELDWTFGPSGGPGGQHANRSNTRAELRYDLGRSSVFESDLQQTMLGQIDHADGVVVVVVGESRSQWRNRQLARRRLAERLLESMRSTAERIPTKPSRASRRRRLDEKRRHAEKKARRRRPDW